MDHFMTPSQPRKTAARGFTQEPYEVRNWASVVGQRIRTARIRRGKTQEAIALACGITRRTLSRLESGDTGVSWGTILSVLWALGLMDSVRPIADPDADRHGKILEAAKRPERVRAETLDNDF